MRPPGRVSLFEGASARGTQFTSYAGTPLLAFTLSTIPGPRGHRHDTVARLVDGHIAVAAVAVDERILRPPPLVRTYTTASDHLLHAWRRPLRNLHTRPVSAEKVVQQAQHELVSRRPSLIVVIVASDKPLALGCTSCVSACTHVMATFIPQTSAVTHTLEGGPHSVALHALQINCTFTFRLLLFHLASCSCFCFVVNCDDAEITLSSPLQITQDDPTMH